MRPEFALDTELDAQIARAAEAIRSAHHIVALTGAGLSVESGIPPFRGPGGLWTKYGEPPLDGYQRFLADPAAAWREQLNPTATWMIGLAETLDAAKPTPGTSRSLSSSAADAAPPSSRRTSTTCTARPAAASCSRSTATTTGCAASRATGASRRASSRSTPSGCRRAVRSATAS